MTDDSTVDFYDLYWFQKKDIIVILESLEIKKTLVLYVITVDSALQQELLSTNVPIMPLSRFSLTERKANHINPVFEEDWRRYVHLVCSKSNLLKYLLCVITYSDEA